MAPDVLFRLVGEEGVLLNLKTDAVPGSEPRGHSNVERRSAAPARYKRPTTNCSQEYEVEPAQLRADLEEFIDQLLGQKLIEAGPCDEESHTAGMSGIVGLLNLDGSPVDGSLLGRMTEYLAFRGPDSQRVRAMKQRRLRSCAA